MSALLSLLILVGANFLVRCDPPDTPVAVTLVWEQSDLCPVVWHEIQRGPNSSCIVPVANACLVRVKASWSINGTVFEAPSKLLLIEP